MFRRMVLGAVALLLLSTPAWAAMEIYVKDATGKEITISVEPTDTVEAVKKQIADREGVKPECQKLIWSGQLLESGKTLADYGIEREATIHLVQHCQ